MPYAPTIREEELKNKVVCRGQGQCGSSSALMCWWRGNGAALRAFAFACVAAATIYGGGKGKGGYGESEVQPERGQPVRDGGASLAGSSGEFVSNLCFTAIGIDSDDVVTLTAAWPDGTLDLPATTLTFDFVSDTDADGIPDLWERINAISGLSPTNSIDAMQDPDGDGLPNLHEYVMGFDPSEADGSNSSAQRSVHPLLFGKMKSKM